jgi:cytidine deaminase
MTTTDRLKKQAQSAMKNAYAPYSKFHVGAALLDENGTIHAGCNVENSAYPLGVCAEASAISNMVLSGARVIKQIMIVSSGDLMVTPCGGCRQKIKEFCDESTKILIDHKGSITTFEVDDLLPYSFDKNHLSL